MNPISIAQVGPIDAVEIPIVPGSITELVGSNGSGKSTALRSVRKLVGVKEPLTPKDGSSSGRIEFGQVKITVGATTRGGAATIENLEGKLSLGDLVDPGLVDPVASDAKRVQALVSMLGNDIDNSEFYDLLPGGEDEFRKVVSDSSLGKPDIVARVAAVKAELELKARDHEKVVKNSENIANSKLDSINGINLDEPSDKQTLEQEYLAARDRLTASRAVFEQQQKITKDAQAARDRLKELSGEDLAALHAEKHAAVVSATATLNAIFQRYTELKEQLAQAEREMSQARTTKDFAVNDLATIESKIDSHKSLLAAAQATPDGEIITEDLIKELEAKEEAARQANFRGEEIRKAIRVKSEAIEAQHEAQRNARLAETYRSAAKGAESILSKVMEDSGVPVQMKIVDGKPRLTIVDSIEAIEFIRPDKAGPTYFADLSDGQRWQLAIRIAIGVLRGRPAEECVLVIDQSGWQDLDGKAKQVIREMIAGTNVSIVTARCSQEGESPVLHTNNLN